MLNITYEAFCEFVSERGIPINEVLSPEERAIQLSAVSIQLFFRAVCNAIINW